MASVVRETNAIRAGRIRPEGDGYACMGLGQRWISRLILAALCGYADKAGSAPSRVCVLDFGIYETSER
jgi:hypothetical protein